MPNTVPGNVTQGQLIIAIQDFLNRPNNEAALTKLLGRLRTSTDHLDAILRETLDPTRSSPPYAGFDADVAHFEADWCPRRRKAGESLRDYQERLRVAWWPNEQPVRRVVRSTFIRAIDQRIVDLDANASSARRIYVYWICAGDHLEGDLLETDDQLTVLLLTPRPDVSRRARLGRPNGTQLPPAELEEEGIVVVRRTKAAPSESIQTPDAGDDQVETVRPMRLK